MNNKKQEKKKRQKTVLPINEKGADLFIDIGKKASPMWRNKWHSLLTVLCYFFAIVAYTKYLEEPFSAFLNRVWENIITFLGAYISKGIIICTIKLIINLVKFIPYVVLYWIIEPLINLINLVIDTFYVFIFKIGLVAKFLVIKIISHLIDLCKKMLLLAQASFRYSRSLATAMGAGFHVLIQSAFRYSRVLAAAISVAFLVLSSDVRPPIKYTPPPVDMNKFNRRALLPKIEYKPLPVDITKFNRVAPLPKFKYTPPPVDMNKFDLIGVRLAK